MKNILSNLKSFNIALFIALCIVNLFPAIYDTIRTALLSNSISTSQFDVLGQMEWYDLINEVLLAFLIVPLYSIFNKIRKEDNDNLAYIVFKAVIIVFILYTIFSIIVYIYGEYLIVTMSVEEENLEVTRRYLQLETIAFNIQVIISFANVVFIVNNKKQNIYIMLGFKIILSLIGDYLLIPNYGVNGVAYSNILSNSILAIVSLIVLISSKMINVKKYSKEDLVIAKHWAKEGIFSGLQSFLDNFIYIVMVAKMINAVSEQGNYWLVNNFIWLWLLIPVSALSEVIKSDCKSDYKDLKQSNYYFVIIMTILLWVILIPIYQPYFKNIEHLENAQTIYEILMKLIWFYIAYALTVIPDSIFVGYGKMKYSVINSLIINIIYYGIFYLCYKFGSLTMSIDVIIMMFGFGMVVHEIVSIIEEKLFFKKEMVTFLY